MQINQGVGPTSYRWQAGQFVPGAPAGNIIVADSWLSERGFTRDFAGHQFRFEKSLRAACEMDLSKSFWEAAARVIDGHGSGRLFPRVFADDEGIGLEVRPAPPLRRTTRLLGTLAGDPRVNPRRKGPDIARLAQRRAQATAVGLDDAVLTTNDGFLLEATTGSIIWKCGANICLPTREDLLLPGVTRARVLRSLARAGVGIKRVDITVRQLADYPCWFLNAVQGVTPIEAIVVEEKGERVLLRPPASILQPDNS